MKESYKRILKKAFLFILMAATLIMLLTPGAFAATTILPEAGTDEQCASFMTEGDAETLEALFITQHGEWNHYLGCGIKYGKIEFWMLKYFILYALEFMISLAGLLAILMLIVGAYFYIAGGLTDDKEKGKTIIKYALGGLIVTTLSWLAVNIILLALTS